ncbi:MAG: hypothetical protein JWO63_3410, partial [Frankiales bacterium]|nr:hypothetical protein [Frankiales bacterium]
MGAAVLALILALVAGCSSSNGAASAASSSTTASSAPSIAASPFASPKPVGTVLQDVALKASDFAAGFAVKLGPSGDVVKGQTTLDGCGFDFTTEAHRTARRQYVVLTSTQQDTGVSNEVVAYDSADNALLAAAQWSQAASTCPTKPVASTTKGVPAITFKVLQNNLNNAAVPLKPNVLTVESEASEGLTIYTIALMQVKGPYLDIVLA